MHNSNNSIPIFIVVQKWTSLQVHECQRVPLHWQLPGCSHPVWEITHMLKPYCTYSYLCIDSYIDHTASKETQVARKVFNTS